MRRLCVFGHKFRIFQHSSLDTVGLSPSAADVFFFRSHFVFITRFSSFSLSLLQKASVSCSAKLKASQVKVLNFKRMKNKLFSNLLFIPCLTRGLSRAYRREERRENLTKKMLWKSWNYFVYILMLQFLSLFKLFTNSHTLPPRSRSLSQYCEVSLLFPHSQHQHQAKRVERFSAPQFNVMVEKFSHRRLIQRA